MMKVLQVNLASLRDTGKGMKEGLLEALGVEAGFLALILLGREGAV